MLVEALRPSAIPPALRSPLDTSLAQVYEQLNAPFGRFGQDTLAASTRALESGSATDDATYQRIEARIERLTAARDLLARRISSELDAAAFAQRPIPLLRALVDTAQAHLLIAAAHSLARTA